MQGFDRMTATRAVRWCMGHRLMNYDGRCSSLHGHNWEAQFTFRRTISDAPLDAQGMVIDFKTVGALLKQWIDQNWDHAMLLQSDDAEAIKAVNMLGSLHSLINHPPTTENIARHLLILGNHIVHEQFADVEIVRVRVIENENNSAEACLP